MKIIKVLSLLTLVFLWQACGRTKTPIKQATSVPAVSANEYIVVDVRTVQEWQADGHAPCSVNYPLQELDAKLDELSQYKKVIFVCRSGHRAGVALEKLRSRGYTTAENAGAWQNVVCP